MYVGPDCVSFLGIGSMPTTNGGTPELRISGISDFPISGISGIRISAITQFRISGFLAIPDFRNSGFPEVRKSAIEVRIPEISGPDPHNNSEI